MGDGNGDWQDLNLRQGTDGGLTEYHQQRPRMGRDWVGGESLDASSVCLSSKQPVARRGVGSREEVAWRGNCPSGRREGGLGGNGQICTLD